jgi:2-dehydro-3-deoxyphosphogluconate aldolase/(4S)-4-hydroxy-2-oxoglutarate aldolase
MSSFDRLTVYQTILKSGLVPLFFHPDFETARRIVEACASGGATVVEFTNRGEDALTVFARLVESFKKDHPTLILGVGSVVDAPTAALYLAHGANYIVAPNFNPEVARLCNKRKVAYIPGAATPTEISTAEEAGAEIVKIFPPDPELIRNVLGPMPWSRLMPSGGVEVNKDNVTRWIKAGACALGIGSHLVSRAALANRDFDSIREGTRSMLAWIQEARSSQ